MRYDKFLGSIEAGSEYWAWYHQQTGMYWKYISVGFFWDKYWRKGDWGWTLLESLGDWELSSDLLVRNNSLEPIHKIVAEPGNHIWATSNVHKFREKQSVWHCREWSISSARRKTVYQGHPTTNRLLTSEPFCSWNVIATQTAADEWWYTVHSSCIVELLLISLRSIQTSRETDTGR